MSPHFLSWAGQLVLWLAVVAYCGSKMHWRPKGLFLAAAHLAVFTGVIVLYLLSCVWIDNNVSLLRTLVRRFTSPVRDFASTFLHPS